METKTEVGLAEGKLVRDGIPDKIRATGEEPVIRFVDEQEFKRRLADKLFEEAMEVYSSKTPVQLLEELGDCKEVFDTIIRQNAINLSTVSQISAGLEPPTAGLPLNEEGFYKVRLLIGSEMYRYATTNDLPSSNRLAQVYNSIYKLGQTAELSANLIAQSQLSKREKLGGFTTRVVLVGVQK